jgi:hypothetical protein
MKNATNNKDSFDMAGTSLSSDEERTYNWNGEQRRPKDWSVGDR